jgi:hypothetical protein
MAVGMKGLQGEMPPTDPAPTADNPSPGGIGIGSALLSEADAWLGDDAVWVIQSTEYNVSAYDEDFTTASLVFIQNTADYLIYLRDLILEDKAKPHEIAEASLIASRFTAINEEYEQYVEDMESALQREVRKTRLFSRGGTKPPSISPPSRGWRPPTTPVTSGAR